MFIKFAFPWLFDEADDDTTGGGLGGGGGSVDQAADAEGSQDAPEEIEIHDSLASRMSDKAQQALLDIKKDKAAKAAARSAGSNQAAKAPAAAAKPAVSPSSTPPAKPAKPAAPAAGDAAAAAAAGGDELPPPDTTGMDDGQRAKFIELHKDNAKVRKRAQEAEAARDDLKAKHEAAQQRLTEMENSPNAASGNMFAEFTDAREVGAWVADAQARVRLLLDKSQTSKVHKDPAGEEIDLAEDEAGNLQAAYQTLQHAGVWNQQRTTHAQSIEKAKPVVAAFKEVPEFSQHHAEIAKQDPHAYWPQIVARAAIGALVESGAFRLVRKGFVKAAAASSAAPATSGAQKGTATPQNSAPAEVTGGQPPAGRADAGGSDDIPSELLQRAMKGDQEALREVVRLKTIRGSKRAAA